MPIPKENLAQASEFAVASELCRRGMYAQLTMGTHKRTDILVESDNLLLRVQVKGKQVKEWPGVTGVFGEGSILVFVDYYAKSLADTPDFYVLTTSDWESLLRKEIIETGKLADGNTRIDEFNCPIWKDGWRGMNVKPHQIAEHKDRWDKIKSILG